MAYQERVDIDRLYDLIYDAQSEQLRVVTREEFEQLFGSISSFKDMKELYYDKSEVYLKILDVLKEAGVITDEQYNELVSRIESVSTVANRADGKADDLRDDVGTVTGDDLQTQVTTANSTALRAENTANDAHDLVIYETTIEEVGTVRFDVNQANSNASSAVTTANNAQTTANTANSKADDLRDDVGTVTGDDLQTQATALREDVGTVTGDDLQTQVTTVNGTASDAYGLANTANGNASTALSRANTANGNASTALSRANTANSNASTALSTASDAQTTANTANNNASTALSTANTADSNASTALSTANTADSNASTALSTANTANGNATTALSTANTADGKANQLRTDVGTVNQTDDGSLQQQITYLPSYIKRLFVSNTISTDDDDVTNYAHIDLNDTVDICGVISELGAKTIRDTGSITLNFYISDPDNIVTKRSGTITNPNTYSFSFSYWFSKNGLYIIACEHLKYAVWVGDFALAGHTHTKSEITDFSHSHSISDVTNLQTSLNGKANSIHNHTLSDISDYTDSDWQSFPYTPYAEDFSTSNKIMYRAKGDTIVITGVGKLTSSLSANDSIVIGSFVLKYAPSVPVYAPWTGNNQQGYIMIGTNGNVTLYNRNGSSGTMSAGNYFVIDCTYII